MPGKVTFSRTAAVDAGAEEFSKKETVWATNVRGMRSHETRACIKAEGWVGDIYLPDTVVAKETPDLVGWLRKNSIRFRSV
jgi:hypothetical protein